MGTIGLSPAKAGIEHVLKGRCPQSIITRVREVSVSDRKRDAGDICRETVSKEKCLKQPSLVRAVGGEKGEVSTWRFWG
jgi:hypothetical protein